MPQATPTTIAPRDQAGTWGPWLLGIVVFAALVGAAALLMRRRASAAEEDDEADTVPPPFPAAGPEPRTGDGDAALAVQLRPTRAGLNMLSATVECELSVANLGEGVAEDIRVGVSLTSAHAGQAAELDELRAAPLTRPAVPVFALPPRETQHARIVAALPRAAIRPMRAGERDMFVPLVTIDLRYVAGGRPRQLSQTFLIGVERVDSAKLAPFWLDAPPRTHDSVAARLQGPPIHG